MIVKSVIKDRIDIVFFGFSVEAFFLFKRLYGLRSPYVLVSVSF